MDLYCRVEDGNVIGGPSTLPDNYANYSNGFFNLSAEEVVPYGFYLYINPDYDNATQELGYYIIDSNNFTVTNEVVNLTQEQIDSRRLTYMESKKSELVYAVQSHLDSTARTRGYDGILSLCSYDGDQDPVFAAEALAGKSWRSACWRYCYQVMDDVLNGDREIPTVEVLISELPQINW